MMNPTAKAGSNPIEPTMRTLGQLSPSSQDVVIALVRQLEEREGSALSLHQRRLK